MSYLWASSSLYWLRSDSADRLNIQVARCAGPAKRPLAFDLESVTMRGSTEDPKTMALTTGIRGIGPSASSCWRRLGVDVFLRHRYAVESSPSYLRYDRSKNTDLMSLSTSTTMITGPDRNRRHRIVSALSLRSRRAAAGLRRPSESRALLAFIARARCCRCVVPEKRPLVFTL